MLRISSASPTQVVVDLSALAQNVARLRERLAPSCQMIAVVKANAYGHGAVEVAQALVSLGCAKLGVATVAEGIELREAGIFADILVLGPVVPRELGDLLHHRLTPLVYDEAIMLALRMRAQQAPCPVHIEVDTGMGRLGLAANRVVPLLQSGQLNGPLQLEGLMTHFADADNADPSFSHDQISRFREVLRDVRTAGFTIPMAHMANSAGLLRYPESHFDAVRPGLGLYGYLSGSTDADFPPLQPLLSWTTHIVQIRALQPGQSVSYNRTFQATRASRIAVLPVGYADGYSRRLSNKGAVLVHGRRAPVVGRVCMDMTMIDITDIPETQTGDDVVLIGTQAQASITADDLATWQDTIAYEVLCAIGPRVRRTYCGGPEPRPEESEPSGQSD